MKPCVASITGILLVLILLLLAGCQATQTPTYEAVRPTSTSTMAPSPTLTSTTTPSPPPTQTPTPSPEPSRTPHPTPTPTLIPPSSPLADFPLNVGNTWVYASLSYAGYDTQTITITATMTETVVKTLWQPPFFVAEIKTEYKPDPIPDDLKENEWAWLLPLEAWTEPHWYVISGTQVYGYYKADALDLEDTDWRALLSESAYEYVFPLTVGACWNVSTAQLVEPGECDSPDVTQVFDGVESSRLTSDADARVLTIPYWTMAVNDSYKEFEAQIELHDCAADCSECFQLFTSYNPGGVTEWFCPGVGRVGGYWNHGGDPFGDVDYLVDYTLHD